MPQDHPKLAFSVELENGLFDIQREEGKLNYEMLNLDVQDLMDKVGREMEQKNIHRVKLVVLAIDRVPEGD